MSVVDEVKQKIDIVEVIGQHTRLTKSGKTFKGLCPFHSEKHGSFFVYPDQQSWHCFGACGTGGDVFSFIMKKEGISFSEALRQLAEKAGVTIPEVAGAARVKEKNERLYQANEAAAEYYHQLLLKSSEAERLRLYLAKRGLNAQSVETFKLGYSPNSWDSLKQYLMERGFSEAELIQAGLVMETEAKLKHDRFRHRLMFPITDIRGRIIGFGARALDDSMPKYLNSPDTPLFHKAENLYALHLAKDAMRQKNQAVIVEGYMDVILAHQYDFKNVMASMGTAITETHAQNLKKITKNLVLALDADSAGEEATLRSVSLENNLGAEIRVAILPDGKDPDEIIKEDSQKWQQLIREAMPILDYTFERITAGLDLKSSRGKSAAVDRLLPMVSQIKDVVRQTYYVYKLAQLAGVSPKKLELLLAQSRSQTRGGKSGGGSAERRSVAISTIEEHFLALLLKHPELKGRCPEIRPDYFESSENREIFYALQRIEELEQLKERLDDAIKEHCETLLRREFPSNQIEIRLAETTLRLREDYLKRLKQKREDSLSQEEDLEINNQLREVFLEREKLGQQKRRQK